MIKNKITRITFALLTLFSLFIIPVCSDNIENNPLVLTSKAAGNDAKELSKEIEKIPEIKDIKKEDSKKIIDLMKKYNNLTIAEQVEVGNYNKLEEVYKSLLDSGLITDEAKKDIEEKKIKEKKQSDKEISNKDVEKSQEFVFDIDEKGNTSIIIRFTEDVDNDGKKDVPERIVLTSPEGKTYPIANSSIGLEDTGVMRINLTWTSNFLQLDFSEAKQGRWSINTSIPVTYTQKEYIGPTQKIKPENNKEHDLAQSPSNTQGAETNVDSKNGDNIVQNPNKESRFSIGNILFIALMSGTIIFIFVKVKKNNQGANKADSNKKIDNYNNNVIIPEVKEDDLDEEEINRELRLLNQRKSNEEYDKYNVDEENNFNNQNLEKEKLEEQKETSEENHNNGISAYEEHYNYGDDDEEENKEIKDNDEYEYEDDFTKL